MEEEEDFSGCMKESSKEETHLPVLSSSSVLIIQSLSVCVCVCVCVCIFLVSFSTRSVPSLQVWFDRDNKELISCVDSFAVTEMLRMLV